ncbi:MAG: nuclease [Asgard group archaeon]|nr:nuclease [Asgard group archaeon]
MTKVKIFWDPRGYTLDSVGQKDFLKTTDGDTPYVSISIRMLSVDTPEVHYPGNENPKNHDGKFKELADWIKEKKAPINPGLGDYLQKKLATGKAGTLQKEQGELATKEFEKLLDRKLTKPDGRKRKVFLRTADENFDQYGRLLAYIAPSYTKTERNALSYKEMATFNLLMIESGWGASFPIYPSLPKYKDLVLLQEAAKNAFNNKSGAWKNPNTLTGYEFRMCHRLWKVTKKLVDGDNLNSYEKYGWVERYCFDMTTLTIYEPQEYYKVKPYNRIFIWPKDVHLAVGKLNLKPED